MTFLWPMLLWLLLVLPGLAVAYVIVVRRKRNVAHAYARLAALNATRAANATTLKRRIPPVLYLLALGASLIALARPAAVVSLPSQYQTIILAIDMSGSMSAKDVSPDRFGSARAAARAFVADQSINTRIGVVAFAGAASLVQPPTEDRDDILAAIDRLQLQFSTAVGSAILASLKAIFPDEDFEVSSTNARRETSHGSEGARSKQHAAPSTAPDKDRPDPVAPGSYGSAAVILFTDGQTTTGPDPLEAARIAADHGVRIYTVGIGTLKGEVVTIEGWSMRVRVDEDALKAIATMTRGEYFYGGTANDIKQVYQRLNARLFWERKQTEITALFAGIAGVLAFISGVLSLLWFNRIF